MSDPKSNQPEEASLEGVLERIIFFSEETNYCVGEFHTETQTGPVTIVGPLPGVQCGETLHLRGRWEQHREHGNQFRVKSFRSTLPASVHGIRKYLGSGLVPGIGKHFANKIVDQFGEKTLQIISEESARLKDVPGIGKKRATDIKLAWDEQQAVRNVMMFLQTYGVSTSQCLRLVKTYGNSAQQLLEEEPYRVALEIQGIGFKTADRIAINLGFANDSPQRIDAGILFSLQELEGNGHTGIPPDELQSYASKLLEAEPALVATRLSALTEDKSLLINEGSPLLQLPATAFAEGKIATGVHRLLSHDSKLPPIKIEAAVEWAQQRAGFDFAQEQAEAVRNCISRKLSIITGGPGTGKTTILRAIVEILLAKKVNMLLASPTGRAARRMAEATGAPAQTIHRLLRFEPRLGRFTANENNPLDCAFLIVDEAGMLDNSLASALFRALPATAQAVLVGDVDQLPSVGAGNVLQDLIQCRRLHITRLTKIFRQQEQSSIVTVAHGILAGQPAPPKPVRSVGDLDSGKDLQFIYTPTPDECLEAVTQLCRDYIPAQYQADPVMDVQVIAPMHKGVAGIANFNQRLQAALNPEQSALQVGSTFFHAGDKIIQTRNNYEKGIFNGDMGRVTTLDLKSGTLTADFDGNKIVFERAEMINLQPAFAISVHKSQGSEFPIVVLPLLKQHFLLLQRNLLYTALTRGRKKVFIVGDPAAYAIAVRNKECATRRTDLQRKIQALVPPA